MILGMWIYIARFYFEAASAWPEWLFLVFFNHDGFEWNLNRSVWQTMGIVTHLV